MRTCAIVLLTGLAALNAQVLSDQELLDNGNGALGQSDFVDALAYFFAYAQRFPLGMQLDPNHAGQVNEVIRKTRDILRTTVQNERNLRDEMNRRRSTGPYETGSYGISGPPPVGKASPQGARTASMICRGGDGLRFGLAGASFGMTGPMFLVGFRAAMGAGKAALQPGECAWLDRVLQEEEPRVICHPVSARDLNMQWTSDGQISALNNPAAPYLSDLASPASYFTFSVFNNGKGCMVATNVPVRRGAPAQGDKR